MKKLLCVFLCGILMFSLPGCSIEEAFGSAVFLFLAATGDDRAEKEDIFTFVTENRDDLLRCIEENDHSAFERHKIIQSITVNTDHVDYDCGGAGVGSGTSYRGFFYSSKGDMTAPWCIQTGAKLTASGAGFEWQESSGDNWYYVEMICEGFYYYEASF